MAQALGVALRTHLVPSVQRSYSSATRRYIAFCQERELEPWPVEETWLCVWVLVLCSSIKTSSLGVYLAAVKHSQMLEGWKWTLEKNSPRLRAVMRYVKRRYGMTGKAMKTAVTLMKLRTMLPRLRGWPVLRNMTHDDRLFATASVIAVCGFLRGGEFATSRASDRNVLTGGQVYTELVGGVEAVVVAVSKPKTRWWLDSVKVPCFGRSTGDDLNPVRLLKGYRDLSSVRLGMRDPAFRMANGAAMTRDWMVRRTEELMEAEGLVDVNDDGSARRILAASWRAGGVRSAKDAGVSDTMIMILGRWTSLAWTNYLLHRSSDVQGALAAMWTQAARLVGESPPTAPSLFAEMDAATVNDIMAQSQAPIFRRAEQSVGLPPRVSVHRSCN